MRVSGKKEGCRDSSGRQVLNGGGVTSASCYLHNRIQRRPVTCFETTLQLIPTHTSQKYSQNNLQSSPEAKVVKTCDSLPVIKYGAEQSSLQRLHTKPITMSKLHKMITERNSREEVLKEKGRVRISIKRIDPTDNETHPKTPKVKVMILKEQNSQSPVSPEKIIGNKIEDENPKESERDSETNFLFDEWKFIPHFNQNEFLRQFDVRDLRSLQRTRTWLLSIPLDVTDDDVGNLDSHNNVQYNK